jgi:hypothetical protein
MLVRHQSNICTSDPAIKHIWGNSLYDVNAASNIGASGEGAQFGLHWPVAKKGDVNVFKARVDSGVNDLAQSTNGREASVIQRNGRVITKADGVTQLTRSDRAYERIDTVVYDGPPIRDLVSLAQDLLY